MTCQHCNVCARHPCESREEASTCNNNENRGSCLDFDARDVAAWIRSNCYNNEDLLAAANLIEERM